MMAASWLPSSSSNAQQVGIVEHDRLAAATEPHVDLDAVRALAERESHRARLFSGAPRRVPRWPFTSGSTNRV
jgi:hypothetical protein